VKQMNAYKLIGYIQNGGMNDRLLYDDLPRQRKRYIDAIKEYINLFGDGEVNIFSAPGRTEIGGNHTDHNHGCVLAAAVDLEIIAVAGKNNSGTVHIQSAGYPLNTVDLAALSIIPDETGHSVSLIRGIAAAFRQRGYAVGGFDAYTASDVLKGSGLSSSAAFEVLVGTAFNHLYNDGRVEPVEIAKMAQFAENIYFGKPSGLMDQTASAVGGLVSIDFKDPENPMIRKLNCDFAAFDHSLCIVDTGGSHADLTGAYAAIPREMKAVAEQFGAAWLRDVNIQKLRASINTLRENCGDRAVLRALHFFAENGRATEEAAALETGNFPLFLELVNASGRSSFQYLQNVYTDEKSQPLAVALCLTEQYLGKEGAVRVHGGGFAGTIQAFVPNALADGFRVMTEAAFGKGCCHTLRIRQAGGMQLI